MEFRHAFDPGRAVRHGWEALKKAPAPLFVGALIMNFAQSGGGGFNNFGNLGNSGGGWDGGGYDDDYDFGSDWNYRLEAGLDTLASSGMLQNFTGSSDFDDPAFLAGLLIGGVCLLVIFAVVFAAACWVHVGWLRLHEQVIVDGEGTFGTLFGGKDRVVDMILWSLLKGCISFATMIIAFLPGGLLLGIGIGMEIEAIAAIGGVLMLIIGIPGLYYVALGLSFGSHALVLEGRSPMDALDRSWSIARGNRWRTLFFLICMGFVHFGAVIVGFLLCCIGLIFTGPAARATCDVGFTESFLMHTRGEEEAKTWKLVEHCGGLY